MAKEKLHIDLSALPQKERRRLIIGAIVKLMPDEEVPFYNRVLLAQALLRSDVEAIESGRSPSSL